MVEQVARGRINRYQATQRLIQCNILNPRGNSARWCSLRGEALVLETALLRPSRRPIRDNV